MKYIDYRNSLGIGFEEQEKGTIFKNKISVSFELIEAQMGAPTDVRFCYDYFSGVGELPKYPWGYEMGGVYRNITNSRNLKECMCKMVLFINALGARKIEPYYSYFSKILYDALKSLNIPYETFKDEDGIFVFPKGAKELDAALVSEPLEWLREYPQTRKEWIEALKDYSNLTDENASDVADKFRKALERFFQEFFGKPQSLENLKSEYGKYMKAQGVPPEISNNFEALHQSYTNFMNGYAKHHNKTSKNVLEYIMYQTGNIIRLLITLRKEEEENG